MSETPLFGFRLIAANATEAAKIAAMNENALLFESLIKQHVISRTTTVPPVSPTNGDVYIVSDPAASPAPSGAWAGHGNEVAIYYNGWLFGSPVQGPRFWVNDESVYVHYDTTSSPSSWVALGGVNNAIHDNVAGEIAAITEKVTPVAADLLLIEDSAASNAKKRVQVGNLPGGSGGVMFGAKAVRTGSTFSVPNATNTAIDLNGESWDTDSLHDNAVNPSRITIPGGEADAYYSIKAGFKTESYAAAHAMQHWIAVNGAAFPGSVIHANESPSASGSKGMQLSVELILSAGDYVEQFMFHTRGSAVLLSATDATFLSVRKIADV